LYLEDGRTVGVLVEHVKDRLVDEYAVFRETVWDMYEGSLRALALEDRALRDMLKDICDVQND
jgi:conserved oligomeric Golgi complex subunit 3